MPLPSLLRDKSTIMQILEFKPITSFVPEYFILFVHDLNGYLVDGGIQNSDLENLYLQ